MKVLVTGGCGFLGSHVCEFYRHRGDDVVSYDNMTKYELSRVMYNVDAARDHNRKYLEELGVVLVEKDICDLKSLLEYSEGVDFIVHTAAQPAMTISVENPELDFSSNVRGTFNVLETAKERKVPVVSCATIHVYGNGINDTLHEASTRYTRAPAAIDETHPVAEGTLTPLHASKYSAELYLRTYIHSYGLHAASFRLTGLYGSRQFGGEDHGWVANFAIRTMTNRTVRIFGSGKQVRDILYASDVARAFHAFYERGQPGVYNIGGGENYSISLLECLDLIANITGTTPDAQFESSRHGDLLYFVCNIAKAHAELGWSPEITPRQGVSRLVEWLARNREIFDREPR